MVGSLGNTLTWGDQQIPEPIDEINDIRAIDYDRKRKFVMRRVTKKRRLMLNSKLLVTIEEMLLDTKNSKINELIGEGMDITNATLDKAIRYENEIVTMKK
jgi:hypothetical protein